MEIQTEPNSIIEKLNIMCNQLKKIVEKTKNEEKFSNTCDDFN